MILALDNLARHLDLPRPFCWSENLDCAEPPQTIRSERILGVGGGQSSGRPRRESRAPGAGEGAARAHTPRACRFGLHAAKPVAEVIAELAEIAEIAACHNRVCVASRRWCCWWRRWRGRCSGLCRDRRRCLCLLLAEPVRRGRAGAWPRSFLARAAVCTAVCGKYLRGKRALYS